MFVYATRSVSACRERLQMTIIIIIMLLYIYIIYAYYNRVFVRRLRFISASIEPFFPWPEGPKFCTRTFLRRPPLPTVPSLVGDTVVKRIRSRRRRRRMRSKKIFDLDFRSEQIVTLESSGLNRSAATL